MNGSRSRRRFLRLGALALGTSFAGCAWNNGPSTGMTRTAGKGSQTTDHGSTQRERTRGETPTQITKPDAPTFDPAVVDVSFDVEVTRQFSKEHPARILTTLTNASDEPIVLVGSGTPPFASYSARSADGTDHLTLLPDDRSHLSNAETGEPVDDGYVPGSSEDGCWGAPAPLSAEWPETRAALHPGDGVSRAFTVLGFNGCLAPGTYETADGKEVRRVRDGATRDLMLAFELRVSENGTVAVKAEMSQFTVHETETYETEV